MVVDVGVEGSGEVQRKRLKPVRVISEGGSWWIWRWYCSYRAYFSSLKVADSRFTVKRCAGSGGCWRWVYSLSWTVFRRSNSFLERALSLR